MRRVTLSILALTLALAPAVVEAQTPRAERGERGQFGMRAGGIGNPAERVLRQREALGLTAEQVSRLEQLQAQFRTQNEPLLEQVRAVRPAMGQGESRERMRARMEAMTPEQRAEAEARRAEMQQRREQMARATPEERQAMRDQQRAEMRERMQGARANPEVRARMEALRPVLEQLRTNHAAQREQVQAVLTAEQIQRLQQMRPDRTQRPADRPRQGTRRGGSSRS
jgi:Spy/CpxP family protein refolding chaperone